MNFRSNTNSWSLRATFTRDNAPTHPAREPLFVIRRHDESIIENILIETRGKVVRLTGPSMRKLSARCARLGRK